VAINLGVAANAIIFSPDAGKRFAVHYLIVQGDGAVGTVVFESATTAITGIFDLDGTATPQERLELSNSGVPVLMGSANGEDFTITTTGASFELDGFAIVTQVDGIL
jgi:hypothetical protein